MYRAADFAGKVSNAVDESLIAFYPFRSLAWMQPFADTDATTDHGPAYSVLRQLAAVLLANRDRFEGPNTARHVADALTDEEAWTLTPHFQIANVEMMWTELHEAFAAQIGASFWQRFEGAAADRADGQGFEPRIVDLTDREDIDDLPHCDDEAFRSLATAHRREAGWDFRPDGPWIGWFVPERSFGSGSPGDPERTLTVCGRLVGFVVLDNDAITFAHVVTSQRRLGIARRLIEYVCRVHGVRSARGPFTASGLSLIEAVGLAAC